MTPRSCPDRFQHMPHRAAGFSLAEIMVGMIIGILGIIVMMTLYSNFEAQKRSTSSTSDVQNTGAIALFTLQHEAQLSGYAISTPNLIGCNVTLTSGPVLPFVPVVVNPSTTLVPTGDTGSDTLLISHGTTYYETEGDIITAGSPLGASQYYGFTVHTPTAFHPGDQVIVEPTSLPAYPFTAPSPCNLSMDTVLNSSGTVTLQNGIASSIFPTMPNGSGTLYNVGNTTNGSPFQSHAYAIRNGSLTECDYTANNCGDPSQTSNQAVWVPIADNIVVMKVQYGRDDATINPSPMTGIVNTYDQNTPTTACNWIRTSAISIALVARNSQPSTAVVTTASPTWIADPLTGTPVSISLTGITVPTAFSWQNYRYKVFQTVVPLRNITISGVVSGC